jgi:hypothetical protein
VALSHDSTSTSSRIVTLCLLWAEKFPHQRIGRKVFDFRDIRWVDAMVGHLGKPKQVSTFFGG